VSKVTWYNVQGQQGTASSEEKISLGDSDDPIAFQNALSGSRRSSRSHG